MAVKNLGELPSNKPLPNGLVQIKRGLADAEANAVVDTIMADGGGGYMQISFTPEYACSWIIKAQTIMGGYSDGNGWRRCDLSVELNTPDVNGIQEGFRAPHQLYDYNIVSWRTMGAQAMFSLSPGVAYTAYFVCRAISANYCRYYTGPLWHRIIGRVATENWA